MENKQTTKPINKTKIYIAIIVVLVIIASIVFAVIKSNSNKEDKNKDGELTTTLTLLGNQYNDLEASNIKSEYNQESDITIISLDIENKSDETIENEVIDIILLNEEEQQLAGVSETLNQLEAKGKKSVNITLAGNVQEIKKIQLNKPQPIPEEAE